MADLFWPTPGPRRQGTHQLGHGPGHAALEPIEFGDPRLPDRFWTKVRIDQGTDCWLWTASLTQGYGQFGITRSHSRRAHRVAWHFLVEPIPEGMVLNHLCQWRACVNPWHLEVVTQGDNVRKRAYYENRFSRQTHCKRDHLFDEANTRRYGSRRICAQCAADHQRMRLAAIKEGTWRTT